MTAICRFIWDGCRADKAVDFRCCGESRKSSSSFFANPYITALLVVSSVDGKKTQKTFEPSHSEVQKAGLVWDLFIFQ